MRVPDVRLLESGSEVKIRMHVYQNARLPDSDTEVIIRMLDYWKAFPKVRHRCSSAGCSEYCRSAFNEFSIGFVLLGDHRSAIADLILTAC